MEYLKADCFMDAQTRFLLFVVINSKSGLKLVQVIVGDFNVLLSCSCVLSDFSSLFLGQSGVSVLSVAFIIFPL